jgi:hypothetical protein
MTRNGSCLAEAGVDGLVNATLIAHQVWRKWHDWNDNAEGRSAAGSRGQIK